MRESDWLLDAFRRVTGRYVEEDDMPDLCPALSVSSDADAAEAMAFLGLDSEFGHGTTLRLVAEIRTLAIHRRERLARACSEDRCDKCQSFIGEPTVEQFVEEYCASHTTCEPTPSAVMEYMRDARRRWESAANGHYKRQKRQREHGHVYFILDPPKNALKIGVSVNPTTRLSAIRCHNPDAVLLATEKGYRDQEQALHARFGHLRTQREWFRYEGELVAYVDAVRARSGR